MPASMKDYPTLKGKDAERFLKRQKENLRKLKEKVLKKLEEIKGRSEL